MAARADRPVRSGIRTARGPSETKRRIVWPSLTAVSAAGRCAADAVRGDGVVEALPAPGPPVTVEAELGRAGRRLLGGEVREVRDLERLSRHEARERDPGRGREDTGQHDCVDHSSEHPSHGESTLAGRADTLDSFPRTAETRPSHGGHRSPPPAPPRASSRRPSPSRGPTSTSTRTRRSSSTSGRRTRATRTTTPTRRTASRRRAGWTS